MQPKCYGLVVTPSLLIQCQVLVVCFSFSADVEYSLSLGWFIRNYGHGREV